MSKVNPSFVIPSNPVGLDKTISDLQTLIATSSYIDESNNEAFYFDQGLILPLAFKDEKDQKAIVYWKDKNYYPAEPNDNFRVVSFFYQEDSQGTESFTTASYNLNLVVWFNQDKYTRNKNFKIREYFITELVNLLREHLLTEEDVRTIEVYRELENVFSNYSFTQEEKTRMKYPYQAFRIKFRATDEIDCGDESKLNLTL